MSNETYSPDIKMTLECHLTVRGVLKDEVTIDDKVFGTLRLFIDGTESVATTQVFTIKGIISNE